MHESELWLRGSFMLSVNTAHDRGEEEAAMLLW